MKNIIFISILSVFLFISCNNATSSGHTQDDGTVHTDCDHDQESGEAAAQEVFEVEPDTNAHVHDSCAGKEENTHEHTHEDGSVHEH